MLRSLYTKIFSLLNNYGLTAYTEECVPDDASFPFITCRIEAPAARQSEGHVVLTGWTRSSITNADRLLLADTLLEIIPENGRTLMLAKESAALYREEDSVITLQESKGALGVQIRFGLRITERSMYEHLVLGEGVLLRGFNLDSALQSSNPCNAVAEAMADASHLLGVAKEGCVFRCVPELIDLTKGHRTPAIGETLTGRWTATLSGTLLTLSKESAAILMNLPQCESTILLPEPSPVTACGENVCWVGTSSRGLVVIELQNPINLCGLQLRSGHGCCETPFHLAAHKADAAETALPCRMLWLKEASV